mmetsp:Transcript_59392/g.116764  ORF Transcript_59392/g.116764 Transcript_59392/m.116764 type:complete len:210 (-) Transcript_59392:136-765(-)
MVQAAAAGPPSRPRFSKCNPVARPVRLLLAVPKILLGKHPLEVACHQHPNMLELGLQHIQTPSHFEQRRGGLLIGQTRHAHPVQRVADVPHTLAKLGCQTVLVDSAADVVALRRHEFADFVLLTFLFPLLDHRLQGIGLGFYQLQQLTDALPEVCAAGGDDFSDRSLAKIEALQTGAQGADGEFPRALGPDALSDVKGVLQSLFLCRGV